MSPCSVAGVVGEHEQDGLIVGGRPSPAAIDVCDRCSATLGLRAPCFDVPAAAWQCRGCGSGYFAADTAISSLPPRSAAVRSDYYGIVASAARPTPGARHDLPVRDLQRVLHYFTRYEYAGPERRADLRHVVALPVLALPLDRSFRAAGDAVQVATVNVSRRGCAVIDARPSRAPFLVLDLTVASFGPLVVVLEVLRRRPLLSSYEIAGRWHSRVNLIHAPSHTEVLA